MGSFAERWSIGASNAVGEDAVVGGFGVGFAGDLLVEDIEVFSEHRTETVPGLEVNWLGKCERGIVLVEGGVVFVNRVRLVIIFWEIILVELFDANGPDELSVVD